MQKKKMRKGTNTKNTASTHTAKTQREEKEKGTDRESKFKQRRNTQHRFVYDISSVPFFSKSLSASFSNLNFCLVKQIGSSFMGSS